LIRIKVGRHGVRKHARIESQIGSRVSSTLLASSTMTSGKGSNAFPVTDESKLDASNVLDIKRVSGKASASVRRI
jgi:hypothetical protein